MTTERPPLPRESIANVIHEGFKADIELLMSERRVRSALILLYSAIDTMASVSMPDGQDEVTGDDFKAWVEKYLELDGEVTPTEFWGARCGLLHAYSIESRQSRSGRARSIGYAYGMAPPVVRYNPALSTKLVIIDAAGLIAAFLKGVDRWVLNEFGDPLRRPAAEARLDKCVHELFRGPSILEEGTTA